MSDPRNKLKAMFNSSNRYDNFGELLLQMQIKGFRCHSKTLIYVENPITAFCGLNGSGKSTLIQLAAASYKSPEGEVKPYYIKDFFATGALDPKPFSDSASVEYKFCHNSDLPKTLTISRNARTKRWTGYARRPERHVFFAGVGLYLPKVERRDFIMRNANRIKVSGSASVEQHIRDSACKILGCAYEDMTNNRVSYSKKEGEIYSVTRNSKQYSELHMGYGEARTQFLVSALETLPEQSLVLVEEPESSLHPSAQFELAKYFIDVVIRKHHQILLTTHSEFILHALPSESRIYLEMRENDLYPLPGLTAEQAKSLMSLGHVKALHVLVEDECAKAVLSELIRRIDPEFLRTIQIHPSGDANLIGNTVKCIKKTGLPIAAVRDADKSPTPKENIFALPGTKPPEKELFESQKVKDLMATTYQLDLADFMATIHGVDHHCWCERLAEYINLDTTALQYDLARAYVSGIAESEASNLVELLKEAT